MADYYWVNDDVDGKWNNANNWSATSGGAGGAGVPNSNADKSIFDGNDVSNCDQNTASLVVGEISATSGYTGTITQSQSTTVDDAGAHNGQFTISSVSATWDCNGQALTVDSTMGGSGNITVGTSTVTCGGVWQSNTLVTISTGTIDMTSNDYRPNATTVTGAATFTIGDQLGSTIDVQGGAAASFTCKRTHSSLTFSDPGTSTVTINATENYSLYGNLFYNLVLNNAFTATIAEAPTVENDLTISATATLDTSSVSNYALNVNNDMTISGTFVPNSSTVTVSRNWDSSSGTITNGNLNWTLVLDGTGNFNFALNQDFYNVNMAQNTKTTTLTGTTRFDVWGTYTLGAGGTGGTLAGTKQARLRYANAVPIVISTNFDFGTATIRYDDATQEIISTTSTNKYYKLIIEKAITSAGDVTVEIDANVTAAGTWTSDGYDITSDKTITVDGTLTLNTNAAPRQTTLTFGDTAGAGFGASAGTLTCTGGSGTEVTITSAGGATPTNAWDFECNMNVTADWTNFTAFNIWNINSATIDVNNCTFTKDTGSTGFTIRFQSGVTITQFDNTTIATGGVFGFRCAKVHTAFDNIIITGSPTEDIQADDVTLEFNNSNFDITNVDLQTSGNIISQNHNDVSGAYEVQATALTFSNISNEPTVSDKVRQRAGTWTLDFADADNKQAATLRIDTGATIRLEDNVDYYVGSFTLNGTWDRGAGYGGIIHVGDSPFDWPNNLDWINIRDFAFDAPNWLDGRT